MHKVVIEVRGGVIQDVYTDPETQVIVVDWDDFESGELNCASEFASFPIAAMPSETEDQVQRAGG